MFEMSLVESSGQLRAKSSRYLWITGTINATLVALMVVFPLLYPEALPRTMLSAVLSVPAPPAAPAPLPRSAPPVRAAMVTAALDPFTAPHSVPRTIDRTQEDAPPSVSGADVASMSAIGIIIGFGPEEPSVRLLYEYENARSQAQRKVVSNISSYLVDANDIVLLNRSTQISGALPIHYGSKAADGGRDSEEGNLIFDDEARQRLVLAEPRAARWIHRFVGADEFLYDSYRFCLWLKSAPAAEVRAMPEVMKILQRVKQARTSSTKKPTQQLAKFPSLFAEDRQPNSNYLLIPGHTTENRHYVPFAYLAPDVICGNANFLVTEAKAYEFGILGSLMHMAWMGAVCGRLESRYRYSAGIVYNNFPWPEPTGKQKIAIEATAQAVMDERARHPDSTLADLYDPLSMPPDLVKAHATLDRAVDAAYGRTAFASEAERVAFLFTLYEKLTSLFPTEKKPQRRKATVA